MLVTVFLPEMHHRARAGVDKVSVWGKPGLEVGKTALAVRERERAKEVTTEETEALSESKSILVKGE